MAQKANTFDTYDATGIREDLSDVITNISPEETPFYSACRKTKATNTLHEFQTDTLRASADNAHIEGDETAAEARTATNRISVRTQIFKNAVTVADTSEAVDAAGRAQELGYQVLKVAKEQKLDIERALFLNQATVAGNASTARKLPGAGSWVATNTDHGANEGADPTGDGSDARTDETTTLVAFSQARFDGVMESIWEQGGSPSTVYLSAFQMSVALGFTGNNNQRSQISAEAGKVSNYTAVYLTPWGEVSFVPSRQIRSRDVYIMQDDMWEVPVLRPTKNIALAKTGDATTRQVTTELSLICKAENANGGIFDCTTS